MYYVSRTLGKKDKKIGIVDTSDGIEEFYSIEDLKKFRDLKVSIIGVEFNSFGSLHVTPMGEYMRRSLSLDYVLDNSLFIIKEQYVFSQSGTIKFYLNNTFIFSENEFNNFILSNPDTTVLKIDEYRSSRVLCNEDVYLYSSSILDSSNTLYYIIVPKRIVSSYRKNNKSLKLYHIPLYEATIFTNEAKLNNFISDNNLTVLATRRK